MTSTIEPTQAVAEGTWTLDPTHSTVGFTVVYMGVAPFQGTFRTFDATLDGDGLRGVAQASSIDVDNEQLAAHLASPEFFDSATFAEVSFDAGPGRASADGVVFDGVLEVKGNRAPIVLTGTIAEPVSDPWGNTKLGVTLSGTVDRNAVGLTWNAPLPEGGNMLADEVELTASLVFVRTDGTEA